MKNRVQFKKEPKIEICYQGVDHDSTSYLQLAQGTVFDKSDNANSTETLNPGKDTLSKII